MSKVSKIVSEAERYLKKNPFDAGHDIKHHREVWELAKDIVNHISKPVDKSALKISVMWHDVIVNKTRNKNFNNRSRLEKESHKHLKDSLESSGFKKDFVGKVLLAIKHHGYDDRPVNIEGKVLYDADKLSGLIPARWQRVENAYKNGEISDSHLKIYKSVGEEWFKNMKEKLHFEYSKKLYDNMISNVRKNKKALKLANKFGANLRAI